MRKLNIFPPCYQRQVDVRVRSGSGSGLGRSGSGIGIGIGRGRSGSGIGRGRSGPGRSGRGQRRSGLVACTGLVGMSLGPASSIPRVDIGVQAVTPGDAPPGPRFAALLPSLLT